MRISLSSRLKAPYRLVEAGEQGSARPAEGSRAMRRLIVVGFSAVVAVSGATEAFAWGSVHGAYGRCRLSRSDGHHGRAWPGGRCRREGTGRRHGVSGVRRAVPITAVTTAVITAVPFIPSTRPTQVRQSLRAWRSVPLRRPIDRQRTTRRRLWWRRLRADTTPTLPVTEVAQTITELLLPGERK